MTPLYIIAGLLLFACFSVWMAVRLAGQKAVEQERKDAAKDALDEVRKANEARASVDALSADDKRSSLQQWARD